MIELCTRCLRPSCNVDRVMRAAGSAYDLRTWLRVTTAQDECSYWRRVYSLRMTHECPACEASISDDRQVPNEAIDLGRRTYKLIDCACGAQTKYMAKVGWDRWYGYEYRINFGTPIEHPERGAYLERAK